MNAPTRRPLILKAASLLVALFALIGFVAAAGAGGKKSAAAADAGTATDAGHSAKKVNRNFFPASKSAGGFYPEEKTEPEPGVELQKTQSPAQQVQQK